MTTHTIRQATIFISQSGGTAVYSSFDDIPAPQRRQLLESTTGPNSATIVIADRAGRAEIVRAMRSGTAAPESQLVALRFPWTEAFARRSRQAEPAPPPPVPGWPLVVDWRRLPWVGLGFWGAAGLVLAWFCLRA